MKRQGWIGKKNASPKINEISISFYWKGCEFSLFHVARDDILRQKQKKQAIIFSGEKENKFLISQKQ